MFYYVFNFIKNCFIKKSLASFVRQTISLKEQRMSEVCVRGRLCAPPDHWHRNLSQHPPCAALGSPVGNLQALFFKTCFYFLSDNFHIFIINRVFGCRVPGPRSLGIFAVSFKRVRRKKKKKRCTENLPSKTWPWKNFCSPNFHFHFLDHGDHYSWSRPPASQ